MEEEKMNKRQAKKKMKKMYADKKTSELNDIFEELSDTQRLKVLEYARLVKEGVL